MHKRTLIEKDWLYAQNVLPFINSMVNIIRRAYMILVNKESIFIDDIKDIHNACSRDFGLANKLTLISCFIS